LDRLLVRMNFPLRRSPHDDRPPAVIPAL
jgi:hypothetical protein